MTSQAGKVGMVLVGTEILTGKVEERNLVHLARSCARMGYELARVIMVHDDVAAIAEAVKQLSAACAVVVTSGGVGPTHDDVTVDAVARSQGCGVFVEPGLRTMLLNAGVLPYAAERTARVPVGAQLLTMDKSPWPLVRSGNVFLFPGVPAAFVRKIPVFEAALAPRVVLCVVALYFMLDEAELVQALDQTVQMYGDVRIGSYPVWDEATYRTRLTFEHVEPLRAALASEDLLLRLSVSQRASQVPRP